METVIDRNLYGHTPGSVVYVAEQNPNDARLYTLKKGTISSIGKSGLMFVVELSSQSQSEDDMLPSTIARRPLELFTAKQIMDVIFVSELNERPQMTDEAFIDEHMSDPSLAYIVVRESVDRLRSDISTTV